MVTALMPFVVMMDSVPAPSVRAGLGLGWLKSRMRGLPVEVRRLPADSDAAEATYDVVFRLAGGLSLLFSAFILRDVISRGPLLSNRLLALDSIVLAAVALVYWSMSKRWVSLHRVNVVGVSLGLATVGVMAARVLVRGEPSDLVYLQAAALVQGALARSGRRLAAWLLCTGAAAVTVAAGICSRIQLLDFLMMQTLASLLGVVLYSARTHRLKALLGPRRHDGVPATDLGGAPNSDQPESAEQRGGAEQQHASEEQALQTQRLEALGTLAGGVAHDMNNVLGAITAVASNALEHIAKNSEVHQELSDILIAARRGETLTRNILSFARRGATQSAPFRVDAVVGDVEALLRRTLPKNIEIHVDCAANNQWVDGDAGQISHLLINLCLNSAEAIARQGSIAVNSRSVLLSAEQAGELGVTAGPYVEISVSDNGRGIPLELLPKVFEPYRSTKLHQQHSGLGLSMVYGAVRQHRGGISIQSQVGQGTTVTVLLPLRTEPPTQSRVLRNVRPKVNPEQDHLLFVDDDPTLRRAGQRIAKNLGFQVLLAADGEEALKVYSDNRLKVGAVVLDVAMPVMSGAECHRVLREQDATLPIVLASGFPNGDDIESLLEDPHTRFVRKPYDRQDLAEALAYLLRRRQRERLARPAFGTVVLRSLAPPDRHEARGSNAP